MTLTLTIKQLQEILEFANPDKEKDNETSSSEVTIQHFKKADDTQRDEDGNILKPGVYAWITEYPEEGAIGPL